LYVQTIKQENAVGDTSHLLHNCLYFTASAFSRTITRLADDAFRPTGLSPSHAILLMVVHDQPGAVLKDLGRELQLAPSTVTRFADALAARGLVERRQTGKSVTLEVSAAGRALMPAIEAAWMSLYGRYSEILGREVGDDLSRRLDQAARSLEG
jgi:DNA-binding MarR family transcriptional regulator